MINLQNKKPNRLINEQSPYLLQHAFNPVDWFAWSDEAFIKAKNENKPIFLSVGYSTCHWCHVMEHESFEDKETADLMNEVFVSIKVDREERPDIDNIYMMVCQMMNGSGGWPLSVVMTPDKQPFFSGTYFPKETQYGRIGFKDLIKNIHDAWQTKQNEIVTNAAQVTSYLQQTNLSANKTELTEDHLHIAYKNFERRYDSVYGGFGNAPKFPSPHNLMFLLRYWKRFDNPKALEIVVNTLTHMRHGGIFDQVGFGFHRYSTDQKWLVPHFEKMLYDQAMLAIAYTEAYQATHNSLFKKTVEEILEYVLRDMTSPEGGFYSAEDADSEGVEGKFYVWTNNEIYYLLNDQEAEFVKNVFNVNNSGNFAGEFSHEHTNANIFHLTESHDKLAAKFNIDGNSLATKLESIRIKLFSYREKKVHPYKDDKILTDWNSLMIVAFANAGRVFNNQNFIDAAERCSDFIERFLTLPDKKLLHRYRNSQAGLTAHIDDYAFYIWALIDLYQSTFKTDYLLRAIQLTKFTIQHFWDESSSGFFFTPDFAEKLIARTKEFYDGAIPSGNSVMALNLTKLSRITSNLEFEKHVNELLQINSKEFSNSSMSISLALCAHDFALGPSREIIIIGSKNDVDTNRFIVAANNTFIPNKVVLLKDSTNNNISHPLAYLDSYTPINNTTTFYICKNFSCNLPTNNLDEAIKQLSD